MVMHPLFAKGFSSVNIAIDEYIFSTRHVSIGIFKWDIGFQLKNHFDVLLKQIKVFGE